MKTEPSNPSPERQASRGVTIKTFRDRDARRRRVALTPADRVPDGALTWTTQREYSTSMRHWREALCHAVGERSRPLRLAWILENLFRSRGYAFASNLFLAAAAGISLNKVDGALRELEHEGAIVRVHVPQPKGSQRRIFPCSKIIVRLAPTAGVGVSPHSGGNSAPTAGALNKNLRARGLSQTAIEARAEAQRREQKSRESAT